MPTNLPEQYLHRLESLIAEARAAGLTVYGFTSCCGCERGGIGFVAPDTAEHYAMEVDE